MELQEVRKNKARIIIGKNGVNSGIKKEISQNIKRYRFLKIKVLKTALSSDYSIKNLISDLLSDTNFEVIEIRGSSVILSEKPK
ncbi:MAG: YhbY family RNA-binding protein [Candidatus Lokiarchaeota archaeon]|nr:YhbY family RNA-binding protein [Candidatus Lokiarchaeota archaeon]